jgi:acyl-CoA thioesterase
MAPTPYYNANGEVVPFAELMRLEKIDESTFRSTVSAYAPTGGENGAYGGHVYAQSVWAAAQTVKEGFVVHVCQSFCSCILAAIPIFQFLCSIIAQRILKS